jgi:hypothetical protein
VSRWGERGQLRCDRILALCKEIDRDDTRDSPKGNTMLVIKNEAGSTASPVSHEAATRQPDGPTEKKIKMDDDEDENNELLNSGDLTTEDLEALP